MNKYVIPHIFHESKSWILKNNSFKICSTIYIHIRHATISHNDNDDENREKWSIAFIHHNLITSQHTFPSFAVSLSLSLFALKSRISILYMYVRKMAGCSTFLMMTLTCSTILPITLQLFFRCVSFYLLLFCFKWWCD